MRIKTDLRGVVYALSYALDLVGIDDIGHGKRVAVMAAECARFKGVPAGRINALSDLGMLHDAGVSSTHVHKNLINEFDWEGAQEHCELGLNLLAGFAPLADLAEPVLYHHSRWDKLMDQGVAAEIAWTANLIHLVDRVDALMAPHYADNTVLFHGDTARELIRRHAGTYFAPELVELFLEASAPESFWLMLEPRSLELYLQDLLTPNAACDLSHKDLQQLACIFSNIVDAKSIFTREHSQGVARVAKLLARHSGISSDVCDEIELAGFLHDLGKLRIPDEVLDKPGQLTAQERLLVHTHAFETFQILRRIPGFEKIAQWASYHHEEPGGCGYPFHLEGERLDVEARIIRVADIFQGMVQTRPYRPGLTKEDVDAYMQGLVHQGRVDVGITALLHKDLDAAWDAAQPIPANRP